MISPFPKSKKEMCIPYFIALSFRVHYGISNYTILKSPEEFSELVKEHTAPLGDALCSLSSGIL
jgi:hypothetical protein